MTNYMCPFCIRSDVDVVDETERYIAIRDAYPATDGHTLALPKEHITFDDLPDDFLDFIIDVKIGLMTDTNADGMNIGFNVGRAAGQTIPHVHAHLIPRYDGDVNMPDGGVRGAVPNRRIPRGE